MSLSYAILFEMLERISMAAVAGTLVLQMAQLRHFLVGGVQNWREQFVCVMIFSGLAIFGMYGGVRVEGEIASSHPVALMLAGILGGPLPGLMTGLIVGAQSYFMGQYFGSCLAIPYAVSSVLIGGMAGLLHPYFRGMRMPLSLVFVLGVVEEHIQLISIWNYVPAAEADLFIKYASLPSMIVNSGALVIFVIMLRRAYEREERMTAEQSHKAMLIAGQTLHLFRNGFSSENALAAAKIIQETGGYGGVAFTSCRRLLVGIGFGDCHCMHEPEHLNALTQQTLKTASMSVAEKKAELGCSVIGCRCSSAISIPLFIAGKMSGTVQLYQMDGRAMTYSDRIFGHDLGQLFSTQLELAETERQRKLAGEAKLMMLHMQIQPHFMFNTLNTISSFIRTKPEQARRLLLDLSGIFRFSLQKAGKLVTVRESMEQLRRYLSISQAREGDKLSVILDIPEELFDCQLPAFCLQPLAENALQHGLHPKDSGGTLCIRAKREAAVIHFEVEDDGVGMKELPKLSAREAGSHIGLVNVQSRLRSLYGGGYGLEIESTPGKGTCVHMRIPYEKGREE